MTMIKSFADYEQQYKQSVDNPEAFWSAIAEQFTWRKKWDKVLEWDFNKPEQVTRRLAKPRGTAAHPGEA